MNPLFRPPHAGKKTETFFAGLGWAPCRSFRPIGVRPRGFLRNAGGELL